MLFSRASGKNDEALEDFLLFGDTDLHRFLYGAGHVSVLGQVGAVFGSLSNNGTLQHQLLEGTAPGSVKKRAARS